jgi:hypothetical protein
MPPTCSFPYITTATGTQWLDDLGSRGSGTGAAGWDSGMFTVT